MTFAENRLRQMRSAARARGKYVPAIEEIRKIIPDPFICQHCNREMTWSRKDNTITVATLQHYDDGSIGIICFSCNSRHSQLTDEIFRAMPPDHKYCPKCKTVKPLTNFSPNPAKKGIIKVNSRCKPCRRRVPDVATM